jgi:hypothetical protein
MNKHPVAVAGLGVISNTLMPNKNFYSGGNHGIKRNKNKIKSRILIESSGKHWFRLFK